MTRQELMKKIIAYNQSLKGLELEYSDISSYVSNSYTQLIDSWKTSNSKEVIADIDHKIQSIDGYLGQMKQSINSLKTGELSANITTEETGVRNLTKDEIFNQSEFFEQEYDPGGIFD